MSDVTIVKTAPNTSHKGLVLIPQKNTHKRHTRIALITVIIFMVITMFGLGVYIIKSTQTTVSVFSKDHSELASSNELMSLTRGKGKGAIGLSIFAEKTTHSSPSILSEQFVTGKNVEIVEMIDGELFVSSQAVEPSPHNAEIADTIADTNTTLVSEH